MLLTLVGFGDKKNGNYLKTPLKKTSATLDLKATNCQWTDDCKRETNV
jgi:hypothetical protein